MATGFFSTVTTVKIDKAVTTKDKLLADIDLQKQAIAAKLANQPFKPKGGSRAFSEWFFQRGATWWTYLRAGHTHIIIDGGDACEAGATLEDVSAWYDAAAKSIRAGELDAEIEEARKRRSDSLKVDKEGQPRKRAARKKKAT